MKKYNFSSIDKIKTPEKWKANAINIPCTHIKVTDTKHHSFYKLATSLCLTIVCLVSLVLFIHMNEVFEPSSIISNKPLYTTSTCFETTNEEKSTNNHKQQNIIADKQKNETSPQNNLEPTEKNETTAPSDTPTNEPTNSSTTPTIDETSTPTVATEIMTTTVTEPPTQKPTEKPRNVIFNGSVNVENDWGVNDVDIYCKVFDANGNLLGSADLFDLQHEAVFEREYNNVEYYSYYASEKGLTFTQGYYTYVFYKRNGFVVCSGTQYVS